MSTCVQLKAGWAIAVLICCHHRYSCGYSLSLKGLPCRQAPAQVGPGLERALPQAPLRLIGCAPQFLAFQPELGHLGR